MAHGDSHHASRSFQNDAPPADSDPTLADYFVVLARRKRLIAVVVTISLVAGTVHALLATKTYMVQTVLEIGRLGGEKLIDSSETILAKFSHAYIPNVLQAYRTEHPEGPSVRITAKLPKGSEVVILESRGPQTDESLHRALHENVAQQLVRDHQRTADQLIKQYQSDLARARLKLEELSDRRVFTVQEKLLQGEIERGQLRLEALKDQATLIETEAKRFEETKKLLTQQVAELRADIASATTHRTRASPEATDGARAMTLLMLDSQIVDSRSRLRTLEERLYISLDNDREKLLKQLADVRRDQEAQSAAINELGSKLVKLRVDNERDQQLQQHAISDIESKLAGVRTTAILTSPARLPDPVGVGRKAVIALYTLLGLTAGVLAAFVAESIQRATVRPWVAEGRPHPGRPETEVETVMWETR